MHFLNIEQLALQKDFEALLPQERAQVLASMSQTEYEQLRLMLLCAPQLDAEMVPPPALKGRLMAQMQAQKQAPAVSKLSLLHRSVPVWQILLAAAVVIPMLYIAQIGKDRRETMPTILVQTKIDTVFQDKIIWRDRIKIRTRIVFREKTNHPEMATSDLFPVPIAGSPTDTTEINPVSRGSSLADDPVLMGFFTK
jgi:anti-sigma-K factor RskA